MAIPQIRVLVLVSLALVGPACVGSDRTPEGREPRTIRLGPLFDATTGPESSEVAVHPLFRTVRQERSHEVQVLDPIFNWRRTRNATTWRFLVLLWYRGDHRPERPSEWDFYAFPFLAFGGGPAGAEDDKDRYAALFPLLGRIGNFAAFDEVFFTLFPIYYRLKKSITTPQTFHNVTPLIGWVDGGPRDGSWRVLPLIGRWRWKGRFDKISILWPFFHFHRDRLDQEDPSTLFAFWPLFKVDRSARHRFLTFLWPFFRFNTEDAEEVDLASGETVRRRYFHYDFLWPIYRHQSTREFERLRVFPFFSRFRSAEIDSEAFAIPFLWRREDRRDDRVRRTFDFVPLYHRSRTTYDDGRPTATSTQLWPLVSWRDSGAGSSRLRILSLLPLQVERFTSDFEANWGPFWELLRIETDPAGGRRVRTLLRLFDYERTAQSTRWSVPLLYSGSSRSGRTEHSVLLGLIHWGTGQGGFGLRLLYLPLLRPEEQS